jgi:enoyl-CoA hydratase
MFDLRILPQLQRFLLRHPCLKIVVAQALLPVQKYPSEGSQNNSCRQNHLSLYSVTADLQSNTSHYVLDHGQGCAILRLGGADSTNILSRSVIASLQNAIEDLKADADHGRIKALMVTGNDNFFSAGADLKEIARLNGPAALEFARAGQRLMRAIDSFPVPVIAAVRGYCMGGGMDLALACDFRLAAPNAVFGHRGASLGVMTGWGGTQRLPRLIGKSRALQMFLLAQMVKAEEALRIGLVDAVAEDPIAMAFTMLERQQVLGSHF